MGWLPQFPPAADAYGGTYAELVPDAPFSLPFARDARIESPDQRRPLVPGDLPRHLVGTPFEMADWAGDDTLGFVEWRRGDLLGVDRLELRGGKIVGLRRNFDTLGLLAALDPSVTALRATLLSNAGR